MIFDSLKIFRKLFMPQFNEIALFSMSLTCILLISTHYDSHIKFGSSSFSGTDIDVLILIAVFVCGISLPIFHVFSERRKSSFEKIFMLLFASIVSGFGGIWAGAYLWYRAEGLLRLLPVWNVINGYLLIAAVRETNSIEQRISDDNASLPEVALSTLITVSVFSISQYYFRLNWAATFSITVAYATNFNTPLLRLLIPSEKEPKKV